MKIYFRTVKQGVSKKEFDRGTFDDLESFFEKKKGIQSVSVVNDDRLKLVYFKEGILEIQAAEYEGWESIDVNELVKKSKSMRNIREVSDACSVLVDSSLVRYINDWQDYIEHDEFSPESDPQLANHSLEEREEYLEKLEELMTDEEYNIFMDVHVNNAPTKVY